mgnify:CR=1 FL=1
MSVSLPQPSSDELARHSVLATHPPTGHCQDESGTDGAITLAAYHVTAEQYLRAWQNYRQQVRHGQIRTGRYQLRYFTWGQGRPLVFIHGMADEDVPWQHGLLRRRGLWGSHDGERTGEWEKRRDQEGWRGEWCGGGPSSASSANGNSAGLAGGEEESEADGAGPAKPCGCDPVR